MTYPDKNTLKELYASGLSMSEISKKDNFSLHSVVYWMKKYKIPTRSRSDAAYVKQNSNGDPFKFTNIDTLEKLGHIKIRANTVQ